MMLKQGKAAVFRKFPFTIILKDPVEGEQADLHLKIDPGSKTTGFAVLDGDRVIWAAELEHRGQQIKSDLESRAAIRRNRRSRKTRYRRPPGLHKKAVPKRLRKGWLSPSIKHRVLTVQTWVERLRRFAPIAAISQETVRFDTQKMENPEISGVEYQQGELAGYEVREYLLEKWGRSCVYCGAKDTRLEIEHIIPRSKGGSDRVSNLTIACHKCNQKKGDRDIKEFLAKKPSVLRSILTKAKQPLKDAAAVNSTRWALFDALKATGLPMSCGSGGKTKFNRCRMGLPKTHWLDAACVGDTSSLQVCTTQPLLIKCNGWGSRQICATDKFGFPKQHRTRQKVHFGFQTGDIAIARIPKGRYAGTHAGRVTVRASGSFSITVNKQKIGVNHKHLTPIHRKDGYSYRFEPRSVELQGFGRSPSTETIAKLAPLQEPSQTIDLALASQGFEQLALQFSEVVA